MESENDTPAAVDDHAFVPRTEEVGAPGGGKDANAGWVYVPLPPNPWLCAICRLAEAAHRRTA